MDLFPGNMCAFLSPAADEIDDCLPYEVKNKQLHHIRYCAVEKWPKEVEFAGRHDDCLQNNPIINSVIPTSFITIDVTKEGVTLSSDLIDRGINALFKTGKATNKPGEKGAVSGLTQLSKRATNSVVKNGSRASRKVLEEGTESALKVGGQAIAKAGLVAGATSAVVGGALMYYTVKALDKAFMDGKINEREYRKQRMARFGEFGFEVVGSGLAGAVVAAAALTGPAGWAATAAAVVASSASGYLGNTVVSWFWS